jgi:hypothetical protein
MMAHHRSAQPLENGYRPLTRPRRRSSYSGRTRRCGPITAPGDADFTGSLPLSWISMMVVHEHRGKLLAARLIYLVEASKH